MLADELDGTDQRPLAVLATSCKDGYSIDKLRTLLGNYRLPEPEV